MKLRVTYERHQDVIEDHEQQFARGGLLVRVDPPAGLEQRAAMELEIVTPDGAVVLPCEALQVFPGVGVAVAFDPASAELKALVDSAHSEVGAGNANGAAPSFSIERDSEPSGECKSSAEPEMRDASVRKHSAPTGDVMSRLKNATIAEKRQIAQHGNKEERSAIMRDRTAQHLHRFVIRNPHIQLDEICQIARLATTGAEIFTYIGSQPDWAKRPEVALALVRNPKVPVPLAIKMLNHVGVADLRQLAKAPNVRDAIQRAARKKLM